MVALGSLGGIHGCRGTRGGEVDAMAELALALALTEVAELKTGEEATGAVIHYHWYADLMLLLQGNGAFSDEGCCFTSLRAI